MVLISGDAGGSNSRFGGMAARASHWGAGDAAGLYLALGDEAEVPVPLVGSDALVAPRPATARSVTRQRAVGCSNPPVQVQVYLYVSCLDMIDAPWQKRPRSCV